MTHSNITIGVDSVSTWMLFLSSSMEEEERQYLAIRQQQLKQAAADEQVAKEWQEQSSQGACSSSSVAKKDPLRVEMDNKENKNRAHCSVLTHMRGPMDSYVVSQSVMSSGKFVSTSDNSFKLKFGNNKHKTVSEPEKVRSTSDMSTGSHDSINQEMHHFKPIKSVPRTPPKKLPDGRVLVPMVVKAVPMNLSAAYETLNESNETTTYFSTSFRQQLMEVQLDRIKSLKGVLRTSGISPPISAFRGKSSSWQKIDSSKLSCGSSEKEQSIEDVESPRKKTRRDITTDVRRQNFSSVGLSSYNEEDCGGKKVIAIVHNQAEGNIGGHDRRFGGSEKEDSCSFAVAGKTGGKDESDDEVNYDDPSVARVIGVEPESGSQTPVGISCQMKGQETSSAGVNFKMNQLSINQNEKVSFNHYRNNVKKINNNNNEIKTDISPSIRPLEEGRVLERYDRNLDEITTIVDENESVLTSEEQTRIEMLIRQEQSDLELALRLQSEWDAADRIVDRSKGSLRAYELRNANKCRTKKQKTAAKKGRGRQSTLEESFTGIPRSTRKR
ncbi:E3 ubiquitin-protein ligase RNF169-like isoform X2 [Periplaneta americana]|uniref:E3 ubiquitin-protein ligase RNF169-like isoform X2 n=1 Tax=Periplaneta americana TaxID=6978 RepID=UPI0037E84DD1